MKINQYEFMIKIERRDRMINIKRAYEAGTPEDHTRILVDRLWPRGIKKEDLKLDYWYKELTPSTELRKWFNHEQNRFEEFSHHYEDELQQNEKAMEIMRDLSEKSQTETITFIFAAKSYTLNHVVVLCNFMKKHFGAKVNVSH